MINGYNAQTLTSTEADFEKMTWTFKMPLGTYVQEGEFAVMRAEEYRELINVYYAHQALLLANEKQAG